MTDEITGWTGADTQAIRDQLSKLLSSDLFGQSVRQSRFLKYVVDEELAGRGRRLNQYTIAMDVFDRDKSFDPLVDSIVRVEARRLRAKLLEYYLENGKNDATLIKLPKGRYRIAVEHARGEDPVPQNLTNIQPPVAAGAAIEPSAVAQMGASIAVLPFENLSADPDQEYFSDGIAEDIMTDLTKIAGLKVISRHSTFVYKGQPISCREISEDLGVDYVLEGSVRRAGKRIRVTAQLIDASTDTQLWAERYDRQSDDVFDIQDDVTGRIVRSLQLQLTPSDKQRLHRKSTNNAKAHDLFLRAQEQFYRFTSSGILNASALLSECLEADPRNAEAYAWRSRVLVFLHISAINLDRHETLERALDAARTAVSHNDRLPLAHASLGWALMWNRNIAEAIEQVNAALALGANSAEAYRWHSLVHASAGRGEEALDSIERAIQLNPHYMVTDLMAIGLAYFTMQRYDAALAEFERGILRSPGFIFCHLLRTATLGLMGRTKETSAAKTELEKFDRYQRVAEEAFFFNDDNARARFKEGLARAGL